MQKFDFSYLVVNPCRSITTNWMCMKRNNLDTDEIKLTRIIWKHEYMSIFLLLDIF